MGGRGRYGGGCFQPGVTRKTTVPLQGGRGSTATWARLHSPCPRVPPSKRGEYPREKQKKYCPGSRAWLLAHGAVAGDRCGPLGFPCPRRGGGALQHRRALDNLPAWQRTTAASRKHRRKARRTPPTRKHQLAGRLRRVPRRGEGRRARLHRGVLRRHRAHLPQRDARCGERAGQRDGGRRQAAQHQRRGALDAPAACPGPGLRRAAGGA